MSELLSPAGSMEALTAAVQNGADAVYFGARLFNARRGADNFDGDGLERAVSYCHARGVRAHVTLNTLVREDETAALEREIAEIAAGGRGDRAGFGRGRPRAPPGPAAFPARQHADGRTQPPGRGIPARPRL